MSEYVKQRIRESNIKEAQDKSEIEALKQRFTPITERVRGFIKSGKKQKHKFTPEKIFKKKIFSPTKTKLNEEIRGFVGAPRFLYGK